MNKFWKVMGTIAIAAVLACGLFACSGGNGSQSQASQAEASSASGSPDETLRASILEKLAAAREVDYKNATFGTKTETAVTGKDADGQTQQQIMTTTIKGELDKSGEKPAVHVAFEAASSTKLEKTAYEMFMNSEGTIIKQGDQIFTNPVDEAALDSYSSSFSEIASEEPVNQLLDMASDYSMTDTNGETLITIVVDVNKLAETSVVDTSSLPEGSSIATLIASYVLDSENRLSSVRLVSSTSGSPTYRVDQKYWFSDYDNTVLPEWPDLNAYMLQQSGIMTDENGTMYFIGEDGERHNVESIDEDGTIHFM